MLYLYLDYWKLCCSCSILLLVLFTFDLCVFGVFQDRLTREKVEKLSDGDDKDLMYVWYIEEGGGVF